MLLMLFIFGCSNHSIGIGGAEPPNTENYEANEKIACEQYNYNNPIYTDAINLTEIGGRDTEHGSSYYLGFQILSDYDAYEAILSKALARRDENLAKHFNEDIPLISEKVQSAFSHGELTEADFMQYDFLMVDFMRYRAIRLYPRLENLTFEDGKVCVDLMYDAFIASTADNSGVLYFIPIPKGCTEAEVTPIQTSFEG